MADIPSGTVTFLFTDVEGSTRLLHELGPQGYASALAEHRRVIRDACAANGGVEVDTQGDAFFFAFPTAPGALAAAAAMTEALVSGPVQVRVGLHTGTPLVTEEGYVGDDVHLAARVAGSAHGGQVVLTQETSALVDLSLTDLGEHRLKDIAEPVPILQLGSGSFPSLKTISNTNLPRPASSFVGRERELAEVLGRIEGGARLVTLTGPGGSGKTRLALEAAAALVPEYKAGVFWVGLASLRDPALVVETIAQMLGAKDGLAEHIGERELLLLLDNLEQVVEAAPELGALVTACPNLTLLVTSRELLRVQGEVEYPVPPLAEPESVELFCARAQLAPSSGIAELCARLDNLPLAVELAAARTRALSPQQILDRLSQRLDLLKGGRDADPRQQTLRATIEWSYDLLTEAEQQLLARLAVFAGGCTLEAAEEVAGADVDTLQSLVEKSLLRFTNERYWMLETIREYAGERLTRTSEFLELRTRHASRQARLAVELYPALRSYAEEARRILRDERDNMREALNFALEQDDVRLAADLIFGLWFFWLTTGSGHEARVAAQGWLASPGRRGLPPLERFLADLGAAEILRFTGDTAAAAELKRELVRIGRSNPEAVVGGREVMSWAAATLSDLAYIELEAGNVSEARRDAEEALAVRRQLGDPGGVAHALHALAAIAFAERDFGRAAELCEDEASGFEAAGSDVDALSARLSVAECQLLLGHPLEASPTIRSALAGIEDIGDETLVVYSLRLAAMLAAALDAHEVCASLCGAADMRLEESGFVYFGSADDEVYRRYCERAKDAVGDAAFNSAYGQGGRLSNSEVLELAVGLD